MVCPRGRDVTIAGRTEQRLREGAAELGVEGAGRWAVCDVLDEGAVGAAVARAAEGGLLRAVVASAGVAWVAPLTTIPVDARRRVVDTNLTGTFLTLKHAAPYMAEAGGGAFTAISSGQRGAVDAVSYPLRGGQARGRHARALRRRRPRSRWHPRELGPASLVPTPLSGGLVEDDEMRGDFLTQMPLGRLGSVDDVAAAVCFLSSPEASWTTGVCLPVDGGHHLRRGPRFDPWVRREHGDGPEWWGIDQAAVRR